MANTIKGFFEKHNSEALHEGVTLLAQRGWFVSLWDLPITAVPKATAWIKAGQEEALDSTFANYFDEAMPRLLKDILAKLPARSRILERAHMAHRLGLYDFSVPIFLAQADGIGSDIFGVSPYSRRQARVNVLKQYIEKTFDTSRLAGSYWQLICSLLPILASEEQARNFDDPLNRHEVLHGIRSDYGTRMNSCKSFSWLQYVASFNDESWLWKKKPNKEPITTP